MNNLHHLAIEARDFDASLAFYTEGLGLRIVASFEEEDRRVAMLGGPGAADDAAMIELFAPSDSPNTALDEPESGRSGPSPLMHLAIGCDDVNAAVEAAVRHGGRVTLSPRETTLIGRDGDADRRVRYAFVRGPSGESVELLHHAACRP